MVDDPRKISSREYAVLNIAAERTEKVGGMNSYTPLPLLAWRTTRICGGAVWVQEHLFYVLAKDAGDLESERKTRIVAARFNGVDAGTRHSDVRREFCLRPLLFRSKYS